MNRIVVASLVKNEMNRFWPSAVKAWKQFADKIVVLDDDSTDGTGEFAEAEGAVVYRRGAGMSAWGMEALARAELWERALDETELGDFIFVLDADMVPLSDPRPFLQISPPPGSLSFLLYDLWDEEHYRVGGPWQAHRYPRTWLVRRPSKMPETGWLWPERDMHVGHFPTNLKPEQPRLIAPPSHGILHYAYSTPELRKEKHESYRSVADKLTEAERAHAETIPGRAILSQLPVEPSYPLEMTPDEAFSSISDQRTEEDPGSAPEDGALAGDS